MRRGHRPRLLPRCTRKGVGRSVFAPLQRKFAAQLSHGHSQELRYIPKVDSFLVGGLRIPLATKIPHNTRTLIAVRAKGLIELSNVPQVPQSRAAKCGSCHPAEIEVQEPSNESSEKALSQFAEPLLGGERERTAFLTSALLPPKRPAVRDPARLASASPADC